MVQRKLHSSQAAYRRQRQIEDCLFENLQHVPYQSISVSDLCRQVGISRKAFYNYYPDKDACFCAIVDRLIRESMLRSAAVSSEDSLMETVTVMLDFWKNQKNFFDIMMRNSLYHYFLLRNIDYVMKEDRSILEAVYALPARLREVVVLHYYQNMDAAEMARVLGITSSAVYRRLRQARGRLEHLLKGADDYE